MMSVVLSVLVLAALTLAGGAIALLRRGGAVKQALLMLVLAAIMAANVAIWTMPTAQGDAPLAHVAGQ